MWTQTLHLRTDPERLAKEAPELAVRVAQVIEELDRPLRDGPAVAGVHSDPSPPAFETTVHAQTVDRRRRAAREWDSLLAEIRSLKGFKNFLRPTPFEQLQNAATGGPVVLINVSELGCFALIVTGTGVQVVDLPDLIPREAFDRADNFLHVQDRARTPGGSFLEQECDRHLIFDILGWLWETVAEPVLKSLGHTQPGGIDHPSPRVWWCPTGPLTSMPVHAAGKYSRTGTRPTSPADTVSGRVVSSYIPTLGALHRELTRSTRPSPSACSRDASDAGSRPAPDRS